MSTAWVFLLGCSNNTFSSDAAESLMAITALGTHPSRGRAEMLPSLILGDLAPFKPYHFRYERLPGLKAYG